MVTKSQLTAFDELIIQIQGKTAFIASADQRMMLAEPVENEAELSVYFSAADIKAVKKILPKADSRAWLRERSDDERILTLSCAGQDVEIIRVDADISPLRNRLRKFWSERPAKAFSLSDKHIALLKRASAFVDRDRPELAHVYYDAPNKRLLATNGCEAIALDVDLGEDYFALTKDEVHFIDKYMKGRQPMVSVDGDLITISCRVANISTQFAPRPTLLDVFDEATGLSADKQAVAHTPKMLAFYLTLKPTDAVIVDCVAETGICTISDDKGKPKARIRSKRVTSDVKWCFRIGRINRELKRITTHSLVEKAKDTYVHVFGIQGGSVILMGSKLHKESD